MMPPCLSERSELHCFFSVDGKRLPPLGWRARFGILALATSPRRQFQPQVGESLEMAGVRITSILKSTFNPSTFCSSYPLFSLRTPSSHSPSSSCPSPVILLAIQLMPAIPSSLPAIQLLLAIPTSRPPSCLPPNSHPLCIQLLPAYDPAPVYYLAPAHFLPPARYRCSWASPSLPA